MPQQFTAEKVKFFKKKPKVAKYLTYFCNKICHHDQSKIAQSGHTSQSSKINRNQGNLKGQNRINLSSTQYSSSLSQDIVSHVTSFNESEH